MYAHRHDIAAPARSPLTAGRKSPFLQPKLEINQPGDRYEQEADAMAEKVMRMPSTGSSIKPVTGLIGASVQRKCAACEEEEKKKKPLMRKAENAGYGMQASTSLISSLHASKGGGSPMPGDTRQFMENAFSTDFSAVRIHTDSRAAEMSKGINAKAFTVDNNIYFNSGSYSPGTQEGKHLLAHELAHTLQQGEATGKPAQRMIQRTYAGEVLNEFFSPFSTEKLWIMNSSDPYTHTVRKWSAVINALKEIKTDIANDCSKWSTIHRTDPAWNPGMTKPPIVTNASIKGVISPPGTDPETCKAAFKFYVFSAMSIETLDLQTCSIGSFDLCVTVDSIDCVNNTANIRIWMANGMDKTSFGKFADDPYFMLSGMKRQFMWWNWNETISWVPKRKITTAPSNDKINQPIETWD